MGPEHTGRRCCPVSNTRPDPDCPAAEVQPRPSLLQVSEAGPSSLAQKFSGSLGGDRAANEEVEAEDPGGRTSLGSSFGRG